MERRMRRQISFGRDVAIGVIDGDP